MLRNFIVAVQFISSVKFAPLIMEEEEQWTYINISYEGIGSSVGAKAMSDHFGRDKTYSLLASKVLFPNIKMKVRMLVVSCETCQHVEAGSMDSIHT